MIQDVQSVEFSHCSKEERERYILVDVRTPEEFNQGHIPKSINIPHDQMEERYKELEPVNDKNILLICRSGQRSAFAAKVLDRKGFHHLYNLVGGMLDWKGEVE